jgi:crossover junction endodeoxyribonuclease RuvC
MGGSEMKVLGIDPGTATTGFGVVEGRPGRASLIDYGTIRTPAGRDMAWRLLEIHKQLDELIQKYQPAAMAVEEIFFHRNAKTVISVGQARGVILMTGARRGIEVYEYTPLQVKQAVVGYGKAEKKQVQIMVKALLQMKDIPRPDDAADALAVAICYLHSARIEALKGRTSL